MKQPSIKKSPLTKTNPGLLPRILMVVLVLVLVGLTMWISGPVPSDAELAGLVTPTATASPMLTGQAPIEPLLEQVPTSGVLVGTIAIVLIIFAGTLISLSQMKDRSTLKKK